MTTQAIDIQVKDGRKSTAAKLRLAPGELRIYDPRHNDGVTYRLGPRRWFASQRNWWSIVLSRPVTIAIENFTVSDDGQIGCVASGLIDGETQFQIARHEAMTVEVIRHLWAGGGPFV